VNLARVPAPSGRGASQQRRSSCEQAPLPASSPGVRRVITAILVVLAVVAVVATTVAVWQTRTALDTGRFMALVEPVLESPEVADAIRMRVTDETLEALALEERLDTRLSELGLEVSDELAEELGLTQPQRSRIETLPLPQLQDLAAPIASGLEARLATRIDAFVSSPEFQRLLVESTELAHTKAVALLRGDGAQLAAIEVEAGEVRLNLVTAIAAVLENLVDQGLEAVGIGSIPDIDPVADPQASIEQLSDGLGTELPSDFGQLTVMSESDLVELQGLTSTADQLVWALLGGALLLLALTIAVAPRRRRALLQLGLGTAAGLVITLFLVRSLEDEIVGTARTPRARDAVAILADATFDSLRSAMVAVAVVALGVAAVSYLAGRPPWLTRTITAVRDGQSR
jgi:hypothetical protein